MQLCAERRALAATLDSQPLAMHQVLHAAGQILTLGDVRDGCRSYLLLAGGLDTPRYLGSRSTFTLGSLAVTPGGARRRRAAAGRAASGCGGAPAETLLPPLNGEWQLRVIYGPHGAPAFFTDDDIDEFFAAEWQVHYNSSRTGIRLIGPKPDWRAARRRGGHASVQYSRQRLCLWHGGFYR